MIWHDMDITLKQVNFFPRFHPVFSPLNKFINNLIHFIMVYLYALHIFLYYITLPRSNLRIKIFLLTSVFLLRDFMDQTNITLFYYKIIQLLYDLNLLNHDKNSEKRKNREKRQQLSKFKSPFMQMLHINLNL